MGNLRFEALKNIHNTKPVQAEPSKQFSLIFGQDVFTNAVLQTYLTKKEIEELELNSNKNTPINKELANKVATAMKDWALSKGATHYTHWFQPLNGASAEKHEAFFSLNETGEGIELFNGSKLAQQEPDASSFPHGGIRNTFEARGFSAWDPSSPAFMVGNTLCIPSIFVSYNGEALDYKTPLLRSCLALEKAATQMTKLFNRSVGKVYPTLGWEQEYFLIDNSLFSTRPDLILTGRTLFGHSTAKEQQLDDHYFGSISDRVLNFLKELEATCMKLAIPITTRHNEVAQGQYELAPIYDEVNISVDRNALLMDIMKKTALKHGFRVILHEKPFQGMNGSGKHSNWSLETNEKENLLSPGSTPKKNIQFLSFFINIIKAVHDHGELIQAAVSSASNDLRIGKQEAPPSIMSVYIGNHLTKVLTELELVSKGILSPEEKTTLKLNVVGKIPEILVDNTDRNRTSPFAFTGDKFEIRSVGSHANCAETMIALNTMVANQFREFKKEIDTLTKENNMKKDDAIFNVLREYIKQSKNILFDGDGYSSEWIKEAKKRGLQNPKNTPEALQVELDKKHIALYEKHKVLSERELIARNNIKLDKYSATLLIEAKCMIDLAKNHIIPTAINYQNKLIVNVQGLKDIFSEKYYDISKEQLYQIKSISEDIQQIQEKCEELLQEIDKANKLTDSRKKAEYCCAFLLPYFETIRTKADNLEMKVDDELWPLTKYRELLYNY